MIDLTPLEVRKKKGDFKRVMRGYETGTVDDFLELVADRLEEVVRENLAHAERLRQLEQQLRDYKERERALTDALVSAQELREEMREQALREADLSRRTAEQEAERIRALAAQQMEAEERNLRRLRARQAQFVQTYRQMLERELEELAASADALAHHRAEVEQAEGRAAADSASDVEPTDSPAAPWREQGAPLTSPAPTEAAAQPWSAASSSEAAPPQAAAAVPEPGDSAASPSPQHEPEPAATAEAPPLAAGASKAPSVVEPVTEPAAPVSEPAAADEQIGDEELERSLEALQVVFARDQGVEEASLGWPDTEPPADPSGFYEPAALQQPFAADVGDEPVPVATEEEPEYELLLEDAIDEDELADVEAQSAAESAAPRDVWLPKLIEDEP